MNAKRLQGILDHVRASKYSRLVRARKPHKINEIKRVGRECYFNLSPYDVFKKRMVSLVVMGGRSNKGYYLGVTFSGSVIDRLYYDGVMRRLTGGTPVIGCYGNGQARSDVLRCKIDLNDERAVLAIFLRFYREVRGRL